MRARAARSGRLAYRRRGGRAARSRLPAFFEPAGLPRGSGTTRERRTACKHIQHIHYAASSRWHSTAGSTIAINRNIIRFIIA
ncbi:unnamed protein product [Nesidiocoris tenuis]|uniref:Uncharacterized protein n=1 Tax=Nesidiocoris tenuis TaxID=355587 RepID=A0A6H5H4Y8_9HEMI|nr:unnamed protein product [Nesidiocoris tenuis]